ncbi:phytosulfokines 5-like [Curcuma longa]|uniref:phytosulfokines 5-like n=1 Tax=Curcuma longa TaxID=136217 RepID=UPI003D9E4185
MRQSSPFFFLLLLLLLLAFHTAAMASRVLRPPSAGQGEDKTTGPEEMKYEAVDELEFPWHNVGTEGCEHGNEECLDRRVMYEAHLDYIYTQHRPKP